MGSALTVDYSGGVRVCIVPNRRQAAIVKVMESAMATMKAIAMP
jgi:hypothetical protein